MLNKKLFKKIMQEVCEFEGQDIPNAKKIGIMYEECKYLTDEEFREGMRNLINTYKEVNLPNILKSLPQYVTVKNGKEIDPPKKIEDYCKKYLKESYLVDVMGECCETLTPEGVLEYLESLTPEDIKKIREE